jgi:hypothetical protein
MRLAPLALALLLLGVRPLPAQISPRVALFESPGFPSVDAPGIPGPVLAQALDGIPTERLASVEALNARLKSGVEVLVLPYGSAFPIASWEAIRAHLERGGGLVVLGGAPFHQPVLWKAGPTGTDGAWVSGTRQPTFARELLIGPAEELDARDLQAPLAIAPWTLPGARPSKTFALTVRFATRKDQPLEDGSAGPREALLRPLLHMLGGTGLPRACPLLEIDRLRGAMAGGRWVLAPSDAVLDAPFVRACVLRALEGPFDFDVRPVNACLEPGESPRFRASLLRFRPGPEAQRLLGRLRDGSGRVVAEGETELAGRLSVGELVLRPPAPLAPGLYRLEAELPGTSWRMESGLWVRDEHLLREGPVLTAGKDWLRLDGRPTPIVGTTYMASDVHRKFLFEPNPALWDRDFALMKAAGVNFVRTGLWTAWNRLMLDPGALDDSALRALDAFVLTAAKHRIPLCFTFFAFLPLASPGTNPYLDPDALEAQTRLLTLVARRYRDCPWVHYDLINEPSYAPNDALWTNRPMGDRFERDAWHRWLQTHVASEVPTLRDLWHDGSNDVYGLPRLADLAAASVNDGRRPRKGYAFRAFTQAVCAGWAQRMREVLRAAGGPVLVTVGQDEAGLTTSPSHQLMPALDYTSMHTWWATDDLLWDGLVAKVPEKPLLVQETGLMRLEDGDGTPWRSPEQAARLLERKFASAIASRGAGAVEWAWNINPYQPAENEAVIGFIRPDGTAKAELRVLRQFADFFAQAAPRLRDFEPEPVLLVYPHARIFSGRALGTEATKRAVRVLADRFGIAPVVLSDQALSAERLRGTKLILVPLPEMLEASAAAALGAAQAAGSLVLVTGAVEGDPLGQVPESLRALGLVDSGRPLMLREPTRWGGWATFEGNLGEKFRRSLAPELREPMGRLWHEPLPLELAREEEPYARLLGAALRAAGVPVGGSGGPASSRVLDTAEVSLVVCLNEGPVDVVRTVKAAGRTLEVPVAAGRSRLLLVEKGTGRLLAQTPGGVVKVK